MVTTPPSDLEILGDWALQRGVAYGAQAAWNATIGPAVEGTIDAALTSIFGSTVTSEMAVGGGVAAAEAAGAGVTSGIVGGAMAAFAPAGIALAIFSLLAAIGSKPNYSRVIDSTSVRWDGEKFVAQRDRAVGDDETGKLGDYVVDKLNRYYETRPFDMATYRANDPYRVANDPENDQARGGGPADDPSYVANINRYIPDIRTPSVGYALDVGWAEDGLRIADGLSVGDAAVRRVLLRAGESGESIDAFLGGSEKGAVGALPLPQTFGADFRGGAEDPVMYAEDFAYRLPDSHLRNQEVDFIPLDQYVAQAAGPTTEATGPKTPGTLPDPSVPTWLKSWQYGRSRPAEKPTSIDSDLWAAWDKATPEQQASAWRVIGVDPWRELTGLEPL